ncbi:MAG: alpha/beta hydrolase [Nitriliruptor sp.]|nr:MAG: alpha/beta hydrolase [Nitriliruptor sp.]
MKRGHRSVSTSAELSSSGRSASETISTLIGVSRRSCRLEVREPGKLHRSPTGPKESDEMEVHTCDVAADVTLEYATSGPRDAPSVLLLHGNGPNWRQFTPQLDSLADRWWVIAPSLRGHGRSTLPPEPTHGDLTVERLAADVLALLDHLGVGRVHFVGNSLGGLVGFQLAGSHPERLASLASFGTTAQLHSSPALVRTMTALLRLLGTSGSGRLAGLAVKDRAVGRRIAELMATADPVAVRLLTENVANYDHTPTLRASTVPLLLLRCELDRSINRNLASTLAALEHREDAEVVDLAGAGHFANLEQPATFDAALRSFLERHR